MKKQAIKVEEKESEKVEKMQKVEKKETDLSNKVEAKETEKKVAAKKEEKIEKPKEAIPQATENKEAPKERRINPEKISVGVSSSEIVNAKAFNEKKEAEKTRKLIESLKVYQKENRILWGKVSDVEYADEIKKDKVFIKCIWNKKIEILIPDSDYFAGNKLLGIDYDKLSEKRKAETRYNVAQLQMGAIVCFTVDSIMESVNNSYMIFGNRAKAMRILQDYYFTHNQFPQTEQNTLQVGDIVKAHVIQVKTYNVLVECCGVETFIDNFSISNMPVDNCRDIIERGSTIDVKIKKIYINDDSNYLTVIGRTCNIMDKIQEAKIGSLHLAKLIQINQKKGTYTFRLSNGLNVLVYKKSIKEFNPDRLVRGDSAIIMINSKSKEGEFLFGVIKTLV